MNYQNYTVKIPSRADSEYWGSEATQDEADSYSRRLKSMIEAEFPGIDADILGANDFIADHEEAASGPDEAVNLEIDQWIEDNWTMAIFDESGI